MAEQVIQQAGPQVMGQTETQAAGQTKADGKIKISLWVGLICLGFVIELLGRIIGGQYNPLGIWHEWAPLASTILAALIVLFGIYQIVVARERRETLRNRRGFLIALLGASMLASSYICKTIVPILFG